MHDLTEAEMIAIVEFEVQRDQARRRAQRIIDAARQQLLKTRCRRQGIATSSAQCVAIMQRAEEVLMRQVESKPCYPFAPDNGTKLLTEAADNPGQRVAMVHTRTDADGQEWAWVTYGSWEEARRHYQTTEAAEG